MRSPAGRGARLASDQYKANKAANANGGLKWLQRGGGYYACTSVGQFSLQTGRRPQASAGVLANCR
jgi:hypothetical protein